MSAVTNEQIKTHLRLLYSNQRDLWLALNRVLEALEPVAANLADTEKAIPSKLRKSLSQLREVVEETQVSDQFFQLLELNQHGLEADKDAK